MYQYVNVKIRVTGCRDTVEPLLFQLGKKLLCVCERARGKGERGKGEGGG